MELYRTEYQMVPGSKAEYYRELPRPSPGKAGRQTRHYMGTERPNRRSPRINLPPAARKGLPVCQCAKKQRRKKRRPHMYLHAHGARTGHCRFGLRKDRRYTFGGIWRIFGAIHCRQDKGCHLQYRDHCRWRFQGQ